jgi:hypothetical protein
LPTRLIWGFLSALIKFIIQNHKKTLKITISISFGLAEHDLIHHLLVVSDYYIISVNVRTPTFIKVSAYTSFYIPVFL